MYLQKYGNKIFTIFVYGMFKLGDYMKRLIIILLFFLFALSDSYAFDSTPYILSTFEDGFSKTFRDENGTYSTNKILSGFYTIDGLSVKKSQKSVGGVVTSNAYHRWENNIGLYTIGSDAFDIYMSGTGFIDVYSTFYPPWLSTPKTINIGETYSYEGVVLIEVSGFSDSYASIEATINIIGYETITVPAGTFDTFKYNGVIKCEEYPFLDDSVTIWKAPYIGTVKFVRGNSYEELISFSPSLSNTTMYNNIEDFVNGFYISVLGRQGDAGGLTNWTNSLMSGGISGGGLAYRFIFSQEFTNKNVSDSEFVTTLYRAFFNRDPDTGGYNNWMARMANGRSRSSVLDGFTSAQEFINLCEDYGIMPTDTSVAGFVTRFYQQCLSREPDTSGLNHWVDSLNNGDKTGKELAESFVFSEEFENQNTSDSEFVTILYKAFFNRDPDTGGYNNWMNKIADGSSRSSVLNGFTSAQEFFNLCEEYNISAN